MPLTAQVGNLFAITWQLPSKAAATAVSCATLATQCARAMRLASLRMPFILATVRVNERQKTCIKRTVGFVSKQQWGGEDKIRCEWESAGNYISPGGVAGPGGGQHHTFF